jgi:UTP--glucose-1-phosphate uridylyltransferase
LIFVTGRNKRSIPDHFDKSYELEAELEAANKLQVLDMIKNILPKNVTCIYIRQPYAAGLGHAVLCAKPVVGNEPFSVILADDLMDSNVSVTKQLVDVYTEYQSSVIGVVNVAPAETANYGIIDAFPLQQNLLQIKGMVEKPKPEEAPSNLAAAGRYVFNASIFDCLEKVQPGKGGEIQLTDGIAMQMQQEQVLAYRFDGKRYDCGSKLGFMQANVEMALKHPQISQQFRAYLKTLVAGI